MNRGIEVKLHVFKPYNRFRYQGCINFPKVQESSEASSRRRRDMNQVPYR